MGWGSVKAKKKSKGHITAKLTEAQRCTAMINIGGNYNTRSDGGVAFKVSSYFSLCKLMDGASGCMSKIKALKALIPTECMQEEQKCI